MLGKSASKKAKTLNEKEIQEKLYGYFHATEMVGEAKPLGLKTRTIPPTAKSTLTSASSPTQTAASAAILAKPIEKPLERPTDLFSVRYDEKSSTTPAPAAPAKKPVPKTVIPDVPLGPIAERAKPTVVFSVEPLVKFTQNLWALISPLIERIPRQYLIMGLVGVVFVVIAAQFFGSKNVPNRFTTVVDASRSVKEREAKLAAKKPAAPAPVKKTAAASTSPLSVPGSATSEPVAARAHTVQLCLSDDKAATDVLVGKLEAKGFQTTVRKIRGGQGGTYYQIYVGRYETSAEAQATLKRLREDQEFKVYSDSYVRVMP